MEENIYLIEESYTERKKADDGFNDFIRDFREAYLNGSNTEARIASAVEVVAEMSYRRGFKDGIKENNKKNV